MFVSDDMNTSANPNYSRHYVTLQLQKQLHTNGTSLLTKKRVAFIFAKVLVVRLDSSKLQRY